MCLLTGLSVFIYAGPPGASAPFSAACGFCYGAVAAAGMGLVPVSHTGGGAPAGLGYEAP